MHIIRRDDANVNVLVQFRQIHLFSPVCINFSSCVRRLDANVNILSRI